ncbi:MAG: LacI family DNA-binding transcriptional regulator, partial [Planctomycetota bacterium]|nr:LacI family DNA-binding transcriptional regulator [Planctomycetota bacterium]
MPVSQRELAQTLGISQMTVSRALRGDPGVSSRVRKRILQSAQEMGYPVAARFRRESAGLEHVVCSIINTGTDSSEGFHARLLKGIQLGVRETGAELINYDETPNAWEEESDVGWPRVVSRRQVDGVIHLFGGHPDHRPGYSCPVPHISIFYPVDEASDVATVDNFSGARELGDHLGALGHRRVAFVGPVTPLAEERLIGLQTGLKTHGSSIPDELIAQELPGSNVESASRLLQKILPLNSVKPSTVHARFTAIAVYNDHLAAIVIDQLNRKGLRVPEDISVTGFDAVRPLDYQGPPLTTSALPLESLGTEAARLLYWRLDFPSAPRRTLVLDTTFVAGDT